MLYHISRSVPIWGDGKLDAVDWIRVQQGKRGQRTTKKEDTVQYDKHTTGEWLLRPFTKRACHQ